MQATPHACVAAAAADVIGEFLHMPGVGAGQVQHALIAALGGLREQGTTLDAAAVAIRRHYGDDIVAKAAIGVAWESVLNAQSPAVGVVIALANHDGSEGHAVRLLGSSRPLRQPDEAGIEDLTHPRAFTDVAMQVQYFDPWPTHRSPVHLEPHLGTRARFERAGGQCLLIGRATAHQPRSKGGLLRRALNAFLS